ncbi:hypothetical protein [Hoyosella subflava]|uniref:Major facilitator transporter n=1 Tax=Hoyosella subflava (strain DSM 45089 / JCM 17490 / NBRC 109087 / DQS3-9A1) TaxID=443218 RepID=F6EPK7_HOYSD|nr:hypothetical protein [Hoyosella subflava]AEF39440.1 Major facilitator transporter [Hoyosella subflava DQS3-9A1]
MQRAMALNPRGNGPPQGSRDQQQSMRLFGYVRDREWTPIIGYVFYVSALAAGYYYNLTFVQLGIVDLGTRIVGMPRGAVAVAMAGLALCALVTALITGAVLDRRGWSADLHVKIRFLLAVISAQLVVTLCVPLVQSPTALHVWVLICALPLGVGIPVMFSMMSDLIPVRDRGYVAATVAGLAFFAAALYPFDWRVEEFALVVAAGMAPAVLVLAVVSSNKFRFVDRLAKQHAEFGPGRFCRGAPNSHRALVFWALVALMFTVFFIDSLGFLRIIESPGLMAASWQSPEFSVRLFIAVTHVAGAFAAGVLYTNFGQRWLFLWVFGLFAFTHLLYTFYLRGGEYSIPPLVLPMFYVLAVSFYTTLNFALWPDHSTPTTLGMRTAIGVGVAGWLATFLSTALALYSDEAEVSLLEHLNYVNALALFLLFALPVGLYAQKLLALYRRGGLA